MGIKTGPLNVAYNRPRLPIRAPSPAYLDHLDGIPIEW